MSRSQSQGSKENVTRTKPCGVQSYRPTAEAQIILF